MPAEPDERRKAAADIELGARVRARSLRFGEVPETEAEFVGGPEQRSDSSTDRRNLPDEVEPGVTYRDVEVRWTAAARVRPVDLNDG